MRFFAFHLMPYIGLDPAYDGPAWVTCPNALYDPAVGHQLYNRYLDELIYAEELGFDGVCVNEHHQNAYGNMPSPNLIASILARQTDAGEDRGHRQRAAALRPADPRRRGVRHDRRDQRRPADRRAWSSAAGPSTTRSRSTRRTPGSGSSEAHDLIMKAWTEPGPFEWVGKHYRIRYVNPWPRPIQQPHPAIWIPGAGSLETIEFVAQHRYAYMGIPYFHIDFFKRNFSMFRDACEAEGYTADPLQVGWLVPIYVAETDEQAREEYEEHLWYFVKRLLPGITIQPPGYTSARSLGSILKAAGTFMLNVETWDEIVEGRYAIVGSPETVAEQLIDSARPARRRQPARPVPARQPARTT